jgi:hypothetical protein
MPESVGFSGAESMAAIVFFVAGIRQLLRGFFSEWSVSGT